MAHKGSLYVRQRGSRAYTPADLKGNYPMGTMGDHLRPAVQECGTRMQHKNGDGKRCWETLT